MAIVPNIEGPTQALGAPQLGYFNAGGIEPARNLAPEQMINAGHVAERVGDTETMIGVHLQNQIDDGATKAADSKFLMGSQEIVQRYMQSRGPAAQNQFGDTWQQIQDLHRELSDGLQNETQKGMFAASAGVHMASFRGQMTGHAVKQVYDYNRQETDARADSLGQMGVMTYGTTDFPSYRAAVVREAGSMADLDELPADSAQRKAIEQDKLSKMWGGVVENLTSSNNYLEAKKVVDMAMRYGDLNLPAYEKLTNQVSQGARRETALTNAEYIYRQSNSPESADFDGIDRWVAGKEGGYRSSDGGRGPSNFGINSEAHPGVDVKSLTQAQAQQIRKTEYWDKLNIGSVPENMRAIFYDAAINQGPGAARQMYDQAGGDPQKFIEIRRQRYDQVYAEDQKRPADKRKYTEGDYDSWMNRLAGLEHGVKGGGMTSMIDQADRMAGDDRDLKEMTVSKIREMKAQDDAAAKEDYQANYNNAIDIARRRPGGWADIPASTWGQLKPDDQKHLRELDRGDDPNTKLMLDQNPGLWRADKLLKYRNLLSDETFRHYYDLGNGPKADANIRNASIDEDMLHSTLDKLGLKNLRKAKAGTPDQVEVDNLRNSWKQWIDSEQESMNRPLKPQEKQDILNRLLKQVKVRTLSSGFLGIGGGYGEDDRRLYQVQHIQNVIVPPDVRKRIVSDFEKRGIRYNDTTIMNAYLSMNQDNK